jgi:1-aminocyclopropane-1-carboxylate deaminase/D-cysteine desulfhydrase-like pyridoxal-dependent ACC family enzyme
MDPVYSGKGFSGLLGRIREGGFDEDDLIVFIHTGGTPALFAYAEQLYPEF